MAKALPQFLLDVKKEEKGENFTRLLQCLIHAWKLEEHSSTPTQQP
jgi:hypothetical protein